MNNTIDNSGIQHLSVMPLEPTIGAEIGGIDLREPLTPTMRDAIRTLLLKHKVIFFRDQDITRDQQIAFARNFGELDIHPVSQLKEAKEVGAIDARYGVASRWHTDGSWRLTPSLGVVLRAINVPEVGGDTIWADATAVYEGLTDAIKLQIDDLYAIHDILKEDGGVGRVEDPDQAVKSEKIREARRINPPVAHPLVRTHPETGKQSVFVNAGLTTFVVGLDRADGDRLLTYLYSQFSRPEYQVRFKWRKHSIAFWDNRCTLHCAVDDFGDYPRYLERVVISGDRPYR